MQCIVCGKYNHDLDANYCIDCGTNLRNPIVCECGKSNHREKANYCTNCGKLIR